MNNENEELKAYIKRLEKEKKIVARKLERSEVERIELENHVVQTRKLLETVAQERLTEEMLKQLNMFRKFVPQEFLQSLNNENWLDIKLGDHVEREMIVLFSDIRAFTTLSEIMTIEDNFEFINNYLHYIYPPIQINNGFVDKFIGDAVMALFYHKRDAIEAAIAMQRAMELYNDDHHNNKVIEIGIGLHCGKLMLGVIGVENRMQGTVISDAVNLASRLEELTKLYGSALLVTHCVLSDVEEIYPTRFLGKVRVVGKQNEIELFEVLSAERQHIFEQKLACKIPFEEGLKLYFAKNFAEASVQFTHSLKIFPQDKSAQLYLKNCANYMVNGVQDDWDGIEIFNEK